MWSDAARQSSLQARGGAQAGGGSLGAASAGQAQMGLQGAQAAQRAQAAAGGRRGGGGGRGGRGGGRGGQGGAQLQATHQAGVNNVPRNMGVAPDPPLSNDYLFRSTVAASANAKPAASGLDRWVPEMNYR